MTSKNLLMLSLFIGSIFVANSTTSFAQNFVLVNPPCSNSVCVDEEMRDVAQNKEVAHDGYPSYYIQLHHAVPCADTKAQETGVKVHKQVQRGLWKFTDSLCTGQGCHPAPNPGGGDRLCVY
jgi:hypothetical protein